MSLPKESVKNILKDAKNKTHFWRVSADAVDAVIALTVGFAKDFANQLEIVVSHAGRTTAKPQDFIYVLKNGCRYADLDLLEMKTLIEEAEDDPRSVFSMPKAATTRLLQEFTDVKTTKDGKLYWMGVVYSFIRLFGKRAAVLAAKDKKGGEGRKTILGSDIQTVFEMMDVTRSELEPPKQPKRSGGKRGGGKKGGGKKAAPKKNVAKGKKVEESEEYEEEASEDAESLM